MFSLSSVAVVKLSIRTSVIHHIPIPKNLISLPLLITSQSSRSLGSLSRTHTNSLKNSNYYSTFKLPQQYSVNSVPSLITKPFSTSSSKMPAPQQSVITPSYADEHIDPSQLTLLAEECILVNDQDHVIGHDSKKKCHLVDPVTGNIPLHRAFSVFLFNTKGELLLQQRAKTKITFPSMFSNTCCSHPLYTNADEMVDQDALGVKVAAQRRLYEELGIPKEQVPLESFNYLTRVHYKANSGVSRWGEHEIDYILFVQADVQIKPNPNEVDDVRYVSLEQFDKFRANPANTFTPWFSLISKSGQLKSWWNGINNLKQFEDFNTIHRL